MTEKYTLTTIHALYEVHNPTMGCYYYIIDIKEGFVHTKGFLEIDRLDVLKYITNSYPTVYITPETDIIPHEKNYIRDYFRDYPHLEYTKIEELNKYMIFLELCK